MFVFLVLVSFCFLFADSVSLSVNRDLYDVYNVKDFGAMGDGIQDDTECIQKALNLAGKRGGGVVYLPVGRYLIKGSLLVPENVTLEGVWRSPFRGDPTKSGSVLLALSGKGEPDGEALIKVSTSSTLKGFAIYYPEQIRAYPPIPYPWTIQSNGPADDVSLIDLTLINPCYDVGRIENIHFWPFWDLDPNSPLWKFTKNEGVAFTIGKTDGEMGYNLFSIFYSIGMHFVNGPIYDGKCEVVRYLPGSGTYTNCYIDISLCAVKIDSAMEHAGITFVNSSFMSKVVVSPENYGPVKFIGCGFWGIEGLDYQGYIEGRGSIIFEGCHFSGWDKKLTGFPCIYANNRDIIITGCEFINSQVSYPIIYLGPYVRNAVITSNLSQGKFEVKNDSFAGAEVIIRDNVGKDNRFCITEWIVVGPFPNLEKDLDTNGDLVKGISRSGFYTDYLQDVGGENISSLTQEKLYSTFGNEFREGRLKLTHIKTPIESPIIELHTIMGKEPGVGYAYTYLKSSKNQKGLFEIGMNDGGKVYINGKKVYERFSKGGMALKRGYDTFIAELNKGINFILLKLENKGGRWEFIFEVIPEETKQLKCYVK